MNGKRLKIAVTTISMVMFCCSWAGAAPTYSGSLASDFLSGNSTGADGLIAGNNGWVAAPDPLVIRWNVSSNGSLWHYEYTFNELAVQGGLSHFILEVSDNFLPADLINPNQTPNSGDPALYVSGHPSNPALPDDIWGIKFDGGGAGGQAILSFDSTRAPVWGDFYAKDGSVGGAAWNAGFTNPDGDPTLPPANGSVESHILVPDSVTTVVPVPGAVVLGVMGTAVVGWLRRRKIVA